jgi:hypothetical protein
MQRQRAAQIQRTRLGACQRSLARYRTDCQYSLVTGDDSWAHHCDPEMRSQSVEYRYPLLPEIKEIVRLKLPLESAC